MITGAARGIGKAIALKFAAEGANIAFCDIVIDENALATKAELEALGVKVLAMQGDVSSFDSAAAIVKQTVETFGGIDILVNNAGITRDGLLIRMDEKAWDDVLMINLKSVYNYCHAAVPVMMKVRKGCIINVSSVAGLHGNAGQCNYSASKGAIVAFTRTLAKEIGPRNIRYDGKNARGDSQAVGGEHTPASRRHPGGDCQGVLFPCQRSGIVCLRSGYHHRRRHDCIGFAPQNMPFCRNCGIGKLFAS